MEVRATAKMMMAIRVSRREIPFEFLREFLGIYTLSIGNEAEFLVQMGPISQKEKKEEVPPSYGSVKEESIL